MYFPEESQTVSDILGTVILYDRTCEVFAVRTITDIIDLAKTSHEISLALKVCLQMTLFFFSSLFLPPASSCQIRFADASRLTDEKIMDRF